MAYASGKHAYGISDRSGRRYRLREMKTEWTGAKVGPDEFEPKHPQLFPPRAFPDPQALRDPRPESELTEQRSIQHGYNPVGFRDIPGVTPANNLVAQGGIGTVTITTTTSVSGVTVSPTGVQGAVSINSVTVIDDAGTFDSTNATLDSTAQTYDGG